MKPNWKPIATCPFGQVLLYGKGRYDEEYSVKTGFKGMAGGTYDDGGRVFKSTHWADIPKPPKTGATK